MQLQCFAGWYRSSGIDAAAVFCCLVRVFVSWKHTRSSGADTAVLPCLVPHCRYSVIAKLLLHACDGSENLARFHVFVSGGDEVGRSYSWSLSSIPYLLKCMTLLQAFSIFCGLGIHNTLMYSEVEKAMARQKVAIEVSAKKRQRFSWKSDSFSTFKNFLPRMVTDGGQRNLTCDYLE